MKKNVQLLTLLLLSVSFFTACTKTDLPERPALENSDTEVNGKKPSTTPAWRVQSKTTGADVRTYTYDGNGRILQSSSAVTNTALYEYETSTISYSLYYPGGALAGTTAYDLNAKGLVAQANAATLTGFYTYNNKKQLKKHEVHFTNGDISVGDFDYAAGNLVKVTSVYNGAPSWQKTFTYYTDKPNNLDNEFFGMAFYGKESQNLLKSMVFSIAGGATTTEEYSYEFDAAGRVTKVKTVRNAVQQPDTIYTYY